MIELPEWTTWKDRGIRRKANQGRRANKRAAKERVKAMRFTNDRVVTTHGAIVFGDVSNAIKVD